MDELFTDFKDQSYSLIIDESTDTGMEKQLCVVVRYYSQLKKCIVTTFHGIIALESGTAEGIFNAVVQFLDTNKLPVEKCIGLELQMAENDFSELSDFVLSMLALPFSNSAVEREFSR